jgi:signal peptidase I
VAFEATPEVAAQCGASGVLVKRVVALPGENITRVAGQIVINGEDLREDYVEPERRGGATIAQTMTVPADHYFVLGDNRAPSCDSRVFGPVPRDDFVGRVVLIYWPPSRIGLP